MVIKLFLLASKHRFCISCFMVFGLSNVFLGDGIWNLDKALLFFSTVPAALRGFPELRIEFLTVPDPRPLSSSRSSSLPLLFSREDAGVVAGS